MPVPVLVSELALGEPSVLGFAVGGAMMLVGEGIRMWGVGHIGPRCRTRGDESWGLIDTGPYGRFRNPLYVGNIFLFVGVGAVCGPLWAALWAMLLSLHYTFIVRWEESNLCEKLGEPYRDYLRRVPRWLPLGPGGEGGHWEGRRALSSERSTLLAACTATLEHGPGPVDS